MTLYLGSHVSLSGKQMLLGSAQEAASYGSNIFMIYTGAPQNTRRKTLDQFRIEEAKKYMANHDLKFFTVHAPYIVNLANTTKEGYHEFAIEFLREEVVRTQNLGASQLTLHPGSHVGAGIKIGIQQIIHGLNQVIQPNQKVQISLETMAGKGTEIGRTFEELAEIISGVTHNDKLSVTFDTCHVHDAGYPIAKDFDAVLETFDRVIGLDRLKVLHINDSKNPVGSHKDRHANIGMGQIGFKSLHYIVHHPQLDNIPKLLETPWVPVKPDSKIKVAPYKQEIASLRSGKFDNQLINHIISEANNKEESL